VCQATWSLWSWTGPPWWSGSRGDSGTTEKWWVHCLHGRTLASAPAHAAIPSSPVRPLQVLARIANYVQERIPECLEVRVEHPSQLTGGDDDADSVKQFYANF
jgi:hypothetical protein